MVQPFGFLDPFHPYHLGKLFKAIYGLKQAIRAWYTELCSFLLLIDFINSKRDLKSEPKSKVI